MSFVKDVASAHIAAFDSLEQGACVGKAYFLSQGEPVEIWPWLNRILLGLDEPPLTKRIPLSMAYAAGGLAELIWKIFKKEGEPPITRFVAIELAKDHYFDLSAATEDLGFRPYFSMDEALAQTIDDLRSRGY